MKKTFTMIGAALMALSLNSCGGLATNGTSGASGAGASILGAVLQGATNGTVADAAGVIGNIISVFGGGVATNQSTIVGTWSYVQPCVQFESENALSKAGGAVMAKTVESKLEAYYQKVGITPGSFKFQFNNDGTCAYAIGSRSNTGTYTFDANKKTITIKTQTGAQMTAYVSVVGSSMGLTFDASKLLTLLQGASAQASSLSNISQIASSFSGMKVGFEMKK